MENEKPVSRELMTVAEVADHLRVSRVTIYRMMKSGRIKFLKLGERTLFQRSDIDAMISRLAGEVA